jgi:GNAT superfamily N-acetyltransferase
MTRKPPAAPRELETVVTYLEMKEPPRVRVDPPANLKLMLVKVDKPPVHFYRYLYQAVGGHLFWVDRKHLADTELARLIHAKGVEIFVLYAGGSPAGFFEIARHDSETEIKYFGLIPEFQGRGLGKWLLFEAIAAAWSSSPRRVIVDTCTLDGRAALPLYQKSGFVPYARERKLIKLSAKGATTPEP